MHFEVHVAPSFEDDQRFNIVGFSAEPMSVDLEKLMKDDKMDMSSITNPSEIASYL